MAYNGKTNWQLNEIVKPEDMNRIEQGIIDAYESLLTHNKSDNAHKNRFDEFVKEVTGSNATLTITKGNGTTSTVTVNNVANATKATQDSAGQQINTTYIKDLSVSGKNITYTRGNNTAGTITTQDTVYTHPNSGVNAGTYKSVTVNAQGHVTGGSNPTTLAGYGITDGVFRYALGATGGEVVYTMFASCRADAATDNVSATFLLTQCGDFGGAYQGAWLIQISTRGGKYMSVKTLRSASISPTFGYYVSGSTCYFGALFPAFRGDCNVTVLSNTECTLKDFGDIPMAPSGWTTVTPELMLDSGNYNSYAPTKTGDGASGTWGINVSGNSATATKLNNRGNQTAITKKEEAGLYMHGVYENGYPCAYGNVITAGGFGGGQLLLGWSSKDKAVAPLYYRNRCDTSEGWSEWRKIAFTTDLVSAVPVGIVQMFAGNTIPAGWLLCNGAAISRTTYSALYNVIGTTYGGGDGSTTFALPNLIDRVVQGAATVGTYKEAGLPNINGRITPSSSYPSSNSVIQFLSEINVSTSGALYCKNTHTVHGVADYQEQGIAPYSIDFDAGKSNTIYGNSTTVQPPALTMLPIIKY